MQKGTVSLKKRVWDLYAPVYERAMRLDRAVYAYMYERISAAVAGKEVLELATGPGLIAKHVAGATKRMVATDYSEGMIREAKKGDCPPQLTFEIADAMALPYRENAFDVVVIANALHLLPSPETALSEIDRVLRPGGLLIAPNFVEHEKSAAGRLWNGILKIAGVRFEHAWTAKEYQAFLESGGWRVVFSHEAAGRIPLLYAECVRAREKN